MQREVIKWLQSLDLTNPVHNPKRDLATGHAAAEIICRSSGTKYIELQRLPNGASASTKRDIWLQVYTALQKLHCESVTPQLINAVLRREPNAALTVLECLYEHFTSHTLPMHGLDAVGTTRNAYVQPSNAASTAKLLAMTNGTGNGRKRSSPADLCDPLSAGTTSPKVAAASSASAPTTAAATAHAEQTKRKRFPADVNAATSGNGGDDAAGASPTSRDLAARTLQQRLALIDNDELAGGANALRAYPRYARATASTLVHAATASRKDVVLDRPKYTADETRQRAQNTRITQQHVLVQRLQEETSAGGAAGMSAQREDGLSSFLSPPAPGVETGRVAISPAEPPLTSVYHGRFYREPDAATSHAVAGAVATSGSEKGRAGGAGCDLPAIGAGRSTPAPWLTSGGTDDPRRPQSLEKGGRTGSGGNTRTLPKLRLQVHSTSLQNAVALRSGQGQLRDRAAALSRELFAKHEFQLRPALNQILCDVLGAHKQLEHLLYCSSDGGSGEALENVLGHLLAHRDAFPLSCMRACWDTLGQHVEGIAAALQQTPDEYSYLVECFAFAFTREASQVPVLQMPSRTFTLTTFMDGYISCGDSGAVDSAAEGVADVEASAGAAAPLGGANGSSSSAIGGSTGELHSNASSQQSSLDKNANAATRRASELDSDARGGVVPRRLSDVQHSQRQHQQRQQQQLPMIVNARQQMDLAALFQLLRSIAQLLDVPTAAYVLRRYTLRAARPFLLRHGSTAVREAVADVVSATFTPAATSTASEELPASDVEAAFTEFLTADLPVCVLASSAASVTHVLLSDKPPAAAAAVGTEPSTAHRSHISPLVQRQRVFWHMLQHAVSGFTKSASSTDVAAAVGGRLAYCLQAAAWACLGSGDVVIRAVGVAVVRQCCERWWPSHQQSQTTDGALNGAEGKSARGQTRGVLRRLVEGVLGPLGATGEAASQGEATAWWNVRSADTWELRMMVLNLCVTLLNGACGEDDGDVCRTADAAAAACISSFAAPTAGSGDSGAASSPFAACAWQLHLALITASAAVCSTRAPTLTAQWRKLLSREVAPTTLSGGALLPCEGVAVHQLLAPLPALSGGRGFLVPLQPGVSTPTASAATVVASQRAEYPLSTCRPFKPHVEGKACARGSVGGVKLQQQQQTTATSVLDDTAALLTSVVDHSDAVQLVGGCVAAVYPLVPLYQVCSSYAVLDAVLPSVGNVNTAAATPLLQLQVLTATLAVATAAATASASDTPALRENEEGFWRAVSQRVWPLFQSEALFAEVTHIHPPAVVCARDLEEADTGAMAVLVVALFLRSADEATAAELVAAAEGDWTALCASARQWLTTMVEKMG